MDAVTLDYTVPGFFSRLETIMKNGGPELHEYDYLLEISDHFTTQKLTIEEAAQLHEIIEPMLNLDCVVGFCYLKPHGYTGDFEIIDKMYQHWVSPKSPKFHKWDNFFHSLHSVRAVRNRKDYLVKQLTKLETKIEKPRVLDLASGPCTDLYEFFKLNPQSKIQVDCLDMDEQAINYASVICDNYVEHISFINRNAFRYRPKHKYDLIWSAGLFDYFTDKLFLRLMANMYNNLEDGGMLVVGNFADHNPSRGAMELFGQWYLHHRSEEELFGLAQKIGVPENKINVFSEATKVNLFLHIEK